MCCTISWIIICLIVIFFVVFAVWSNLLRDNISNPAAFISNTKADKRFNLKMPKFEDIPRPFSLSRTQLAVWTVIIGSTYIYMSLCHGYALDLSSSKTTLAFLGISAGTAGLGNLIDNTQSTQQGTIPSHQNGPSQGFFTDILSDENGISVHRFQNVVWTVIAIVLYLGKLNPSIAQLPELDGTIIIMTGISSAAYIGLKINENKK